MFYLVNDHGIKNSLVLTLLNRFNYLLKFHWYFINHSELNFSFCFSLQEYEQMSILSRGWKNRKKRRRREKKGVTNWLHSETGNWIYFEWQTLFERVHTHTRTHTHTYTVTHTQTHIRTHTHTPTSHHTHTNTHTNIRILTHTHTRTHNLSIRLFHFISSNCVWQSRKRMWESISWQSF